jgi:hypothetical protein
VFYDRGVLEVFAGGSAPPAAVLCDPQGSYHRIDIEVMHTTAGAITAEVWNCMATTAAQSAPDGQTPIAADAPTSVESAGTH